MTTFFSSYRRQKTLSECSSDDGNSNSANIDTTVNTTPGGGGIDLTTKPLSMMTSKKGSTFGSSAPTTSNDSNYLYDVDGKFSYTFYEKKPELYDLDGKHGYK